MSEALCSKKEGRTTTFSCLPWSYLLLNISYSLRHGDIHRVRAHPHMHTGVLACKSAHALDLHPPHAQDLTAVSAVTSLVKNTRTGGADG